MATSSDDRPSYYGAWLEPYSVYHTRYLALGCDEQHNTSFFATCCSPLWAGETLEIRPAYCNPALSSSLSSASLSSSASSASSAMDSPASRTLSSSSSFISASPSSAATQVPSSFIASPKPSSPSASSTVTAAASPSSSSTDSPVLLSSQLLTLLPAILVPLLIALILVLALVVCCRRRRSRRDSWEGWDDVGSSVTGQTHERSRFAGLPVLTYLRRPGHPITPTSRPPSYTYRRASTLSSTGAGARAVHDRHAGLGRGLAVERGEQVRRESRGLLADPAVADAEAEDEEDSEYGTGRMGSRSTIDSSRGRHVTLRASTDEASDVDDDPNRSNANTTFSSAASSLNPLDEDAGMQPPMTPAVVQYARLSQRGARRLDPRVVGPSEFGFAAGSRSPDDDDAGLQPPPRLRFLDSAARRGSTTTASSRSTSAYYSAPSTPSVAFAPEPDLQRSTLPFGQTTPETHKVSPSTDLGLVPQSPLPVRPDETVHLLPRANRPPYQPVPPSPTVRLTEAFRRSSDSPDASSYAPSQAPSGTPLQRTTFDLGAGGRYEGEGILLGGGSTFGGPHQRVRIVEQADADRRRSNRVSIQQSARPADAHSTIDDYDLDPTPAGMRTPDIGEYDLGERA